MTDETDVLILNVIAKKSLLLHLISICSKVDRLKVNYKFFKGTQTAWNEVLKAAVNVAAPFIGMAVSAKTKNPKVGQATTNILKSISGGKILSLKDMHSGAGLRLRVM